MGFLHLYPVGFALPASRAVESLHTSEKLSCPRSLLKQYGKRSPEGFVKRIVLETSSHCTGIEISLARACDCNFVVLVKASFFLDTNGVTPNLCQNQYNVWSAC